MRRAALLLLFVTLTAAVAAAQDRPVLANTPTLSRTHIAFVYAGDLWTVPRGGGDALRLTTGIGVETRPLFSPDGTTLAFSAEYDGNLDVYTVPATGGVPRRLTYHPGTDIVTGWTPDGTKVLFASSRLSENARFSRLFSMAVTGVFPEVLPLPMGHEGAMSPDGTRIAYVPIPKAFNIWKRYRGGQVTPIWIARLADSTVERVPRTDSNDFNPMWTAADPGRVFFLSDRDGAVTLYAYDTATKKVARLIENNGLDIKSASAGPDAIVYEQFGGLHIFDIKGGKSRRVDVRVTADLAGVRARYEKVATRISNYALSPTGARAIFEARGDILSVPAEKGDVRNLTSSSGTAERDPAWSPDGRWIAYFSDESGEYALHLRDQTGRGDVKKIALTVPPSFYYGPTWSPDSKKVAFYDKRMILWYVSIEKGAPIRVDESLGGGAATMAPAWSPDSRWIAYAKMLKSWMRAVFVFSVDDGKAHQVTDGMSDARHPVFDANGKYLYFTASTNIGPTNAGLDMSAYPLLPTRSVYVAVLKKTDPSPFAPESDEEKVAEDKPADAEKKADEKPAAKPAAAEDKPPAKKEPPKVVIDIDGIGQRILALPVSERNIAGLIAGKANTLFIAEAPLTTRAMPASGPGALTVQKYDVDKRKLDKVVEGVNAFEVSANGEKMLFRQQQNWFIASTTQPVKPGEGRLKTDDMEVRVDPVAEWNQMYREVWRLERDFFYDPNHHGLDLQATAKKYEPFLKNVAHRSDLNYLFGEMLGELSVGHLYIGGGDAPEAKRVPGGLLGCDFAIDNGLYTFARVFNGENWNPSLRAPLTQPGVNVQARGVPPGRRRPSADGVGECVQPLRKHLREVGRAQSRAERRRLERPRRDGRASGHRGEPALPRVDRRQSPEGGYDERRRTRVCASARHRCRGLHELQPVLLRAARQERRGHRRAVQRRRVCGRLHRRCAEEAGAELLGRTRGDGRHDAGRRAAGAEGDDHQRVRRFGRRSDALDVPAHESRNPHRQTNLGRAGRHRRLPGARGRRHRHGAPLRLLQPGEPVGGGEPRRRPGHRIESSSRPNGARAATRSSKRPLRWPWRNSRRTRRRRWHGRSSRTTTSRPHPRQDHPRAGVERRPPAGVSRRHARSAHSGFSTTVASRYP